LEGGVLFYYTAYGASVGPEAIGAENQLGKLALMITRLPTKASSAMGNGNGNNQPTERAWSAMVFGQQHWRRLNLKTNSVESCGFKLQSHTVDHDEIHATVKHTTAT
jgi:hypothetical protein